MFRVRHLPVDTLGEHVIAIHESSIRTGSLGFNPLDRAHVMGVHPVTGEKREVIGVLGFCRDAMVAPDEIGLADQAFEDLALPEGSMVNATLAVAPRSVDLVRAKLRGHRLEREAFDRILSDVVRHRYSRVELSMFVLGCALRGLDTQEMVDYTRAMIGTGERLDFGPGPIADKHCVGGVPGNRTTMVVVPILVSMGLKVPKTSSRAITSSAGTADTMGVVAEVALKPPKLHEVVEKVGGCIAWGGALELAPADDILITVERPMEIDSEAQMVASILAKKKTVGATHVLIDIPVGASAKVRSLAAPSDLREKSLYLAARLLEMTAVVPATRGYRAAQQALDSGGAFKKFEEIVTAQGAREFPAEAPYRCTVKSPADGRIREIDCWEIARVAKRAGAPANLSAGVRLLRGVGEVVGKDEALIEIHAESAQQLEFSRDYAESHPQLVGFGF